MRYGVLHHDLIFADTDRSIVGPAAYGGFRGYLTVGPFGGYLTPAFGDGDGSDDLGQGDVLGGAGGASSTTSSDASGVVAETDTGTEDDSADVPDDNDTSFWENFTTIAGDVVKTAIANGPAAINALAAANVISAQQRDMMMARIGSKPNENANPGKKTSKSLPGWVMGLGAVGAAVLAVVALKK
jgi:hypothetical protein